MPTLNKYSWIYLSKSIDLKRNLSAESIPLYINGVDLFQPEIYLLCVKEELFWDCTLQFSPKTAFNGLNIINGGF